MKGKTLHRIRRSRALMAILVALVASTTVAVPTLADLNLIVGESAQVAYTNGDGVNVRDAAGFNGNVITALGADVEVVVFDGPVQANDGSYWYYVGSGDVEGWVIADFLALPGASGGGTIPGEIAYTGGEGVNVRASATSDSGIVTTLHEGTQISIIAGPEWDANGTPWTLINYQGVEGWVVDSFVAWYGTSGSGGAEVQQVADAWTAYVTNTGGGGLRLRDAASYDSTTLTVMDEGASVTVYASGIIGADGTEWWNIEFQGIVGYAAAYYMGSEPVAEAATQSTSSESTEGGAELDVWSGAYAQVDNTAGSGLNVRYEYGYGSGVLTTISAGTIVWVVDGPVWGGDSSPWFQIEVNGSTGWVHGGFLTYVDPPADSSGGSEEAAVAEPVSAAPSSFGGTIVNEAMQYVGLPYVWGGTTPSGFDCSGFIYYVLTQVLGYEFPRALESQATSGQYVDSSSLQAGDIVFFANTYKWGLSHVGIYIGDGQFVHAGSENTGVTISYMWDDYWGSRYYTARRVSG